MKKVLVAAVTLLLAAVSTNAQVRLWGQLGFDADWSNYELANGSKDHALDGSGPTVGVEVQYEFNDIFSIASGLDFENAFLEQNGIKYTTISSSIPVLFRATLPFRNDMDILFNAGPSLNFGIVDKERYADGSVLDCYKEGYFNRLSVYAALGTGFIINDHYRFMVNYYVGLNNISKTSLYKNYRGSSICFMLAYCF